LAVTIVRHLSPWEAQVIDLIRKIAADSYSRGSIDAAAKIMSAAQLAAAPAVTEADRARSPEPVRDITIPTGDIGERLVTAARALEERKRAPRGSVPRYILQVLKEPGYEGLDYNGVWDRVRELGGEKIALASIRNQLRRFEEAGIAQRQNDKWHLVPTKVVQFGDPNDLT
jgi:hypothetical protein